MAATPKEGGDEVRDVGSFLNVWRKDDDGSWKIMFDIWNSDRGQPLLPTEQK
jgi:ketosteroid isomerase-like protein